MEEGEFKHYVDSGALHLLLLDSGEGACLPTARTLCHAPTPTHPHVTRSGNPPPKHKHQHKHLLCSPGPRLGRSIHRCWSEPAHPHTAARCTHKPTESIMVSAQHAHLSHNSSRRNKNKRYSPLKPKPNHHWTGVVGAPPWTRPLRSPWRQGFRVRL